MEPIRMLNSGLTLKRSESLSHDSVSGCIRIMKHMNPVLGLINSFLQ